MKLIKVLKLSEIDPREIAMLVSVRGDDVVSIIKWKNLGEESRFEIYSYDKLFEDTENYKTMHDVFARLQELELHDCSNEVNIINVAGKTTVCLSCNKKKG